MSFFAPIQSVASPVAMQGQQLIRGTRGRVEHPHRVYGPQLAAGGVEVGTARHQERCQLAESIQQLEYMCLVQRLAMSGHVTLDTELQVGTREWHECTGPLQLGPAPPGQCPPLRSVARGAVLGRDWSVGASLQVECEAGSRLAGTAVLTCHAPGRWSAPPPVCVPATCPPPAPLLHGKVQGSALRHVRARIHAFLHQTNQAGY